MARLFRLAFGLGITGAALLMIGFGAGFFAFVQGLERGEQRRTAPVDGIVALTGGSDRVGDALDLLVRGFGKRLLITGVNEKTTREELARLRPDSRSLFACCVDLDYRALNTIGNAQQTRQWAQEHAFGSLLVVTSTYHMPRTLAELHHVLPAARLVPHVVVPDHLDLDGWWRDPALARLLALEYAKYVAALGRIHFGGTREGTGLARSGPVDSGRTLHKS